MKNIIKRDGTIQKFDSMKIVDAILAAFKEVDGEISDYALIKAGNIADYIGEVAETKELTIPCAVLCLRKCLLLNLETKRETKMEIGVRATTTKPRIQFKVNMKTRVIKIEIIPS